MDKKQLGDHWAYFGDGNAAQIIDSREYIKKKTGVKYVRFIFLPSRRIENMYNIEEEQDDNGMIVREYPATDVIFLERGVVRTRCWVITDFIGGSTPASRRYEELTLILRDTERLLRSSEAAKNRAYHELKMEREQKIEALRSQTNILKEVARARGKIDDEGATFSTDMPEQ